MSLRHRNKVLGATVSDMGLFAAAAVSRVPLCSVSPLFFHTIAVFESGSEKEGLTWAWHGVPWPGTSLEDISLCQLAAG